jgi:hypothetical protein
MNRLDTARALHALDVVVGVKLRLFDPRVQSAGIFARDP